MPQPAIQSPQLAALLPLPATTAANSATLPVRPGFRPYTEKSRGKRPVNVVFARNIAAATAPGTAAPLGIFGCELTYPDAGMGVDSSGRIVPGIDPFSAPLNLASASANGCVVERIRVSGGAGTGISFIEITNPGSGYDYTSPPTVTFTGLGAAAGTACVSLDGRVTGVLVTNAGTYSAAGTITIAAPTAGTQATCRFSAGQVTTVNTHLLYAAHAPTTIAGAYWLAVWREKVIACSTGLLGTTQGQPTAAQLQLEGLDPDQQVVGLSTAPGFTVATGTHPDGTTTIGVMTLGLGIPNGDTITVYKSVVKQLLKPLATNGFIRGQGKGLDVVWIGGNATAGATETSIISASAEPVVN